MDAEGIIRRGSVAKLVAEYERILRGQGEVVTKGRVDVSDSRHVVAQLHADTCRDDRLGLGDDRPRNAVLHGLGRDVRRIDAVSIERGNGDARGVGKESGDTCTSRRPPARKLRRPKYDDAGPRDLVTAALEAPAADTTLRRVISIRVYPTGVVCSPVITNMTPGNGDGLVEFSVFERNARENDYAVSEECGSIDTCGIGKEFGDTCSFRKPPARKHRALKYDDAGPRGRPTAQLASPVAYSCRRSLSIKMYPTGVVCGPVTGEIASVNGDGVVDFLDSSFLNARGTEYAVSEECGSIDTCGARKEFPDRSSSQTSLDYCNFSFLNLLLSSFMLLICFVYFVSFMLFMFYVC